MIRKGIVSTLLVLAGLLLWGQVMLAQATAVVARSANLRAGPGTTHAVVGSVKAGATVTIVGSNAAGDWVQLDTGQWIAAFLIQDVEGVVAPVPSASPPATTVPEPAEGSLNEAAQEQAYTAALMPILKEYTAAMTNFSSQMTAAGKNPVLITDAQWRLKTAATLATWDLLGAQLRALTPPARFAGAHKEVLAAAAHYETAGDLVADGIDQIDATLLAQGNTAIALGGAAINRAAGMMRSLSPLGQSALVTKIVDGDTIDVLIDGQTYRVRYILINTPESGQPLYAEATEANRRLVAGQSVSLVKDVSETDRYQRLLRYVYLADGTFVNAEMVRQGFAQVATFPPDVAKEQEIRAAQQEAIGAGRGLWSEPAPSATPDAAATATPAAKPIVPATATPATKPTEVPTAATQNCDPSYPTLCIPPNAPDLDCGDISDKGFPVLPPDPHRFDRDKDGIGCES